MTEFSKEGFGDQILSRCWPVFTTSYSSSQNTKLNLSASLWWGKFGYFHFWKRVDKEYEKAQEQVRSGYVRRRCSDGQIPHKCSKVTAVLMKNPTDGISLGFILSCSRNRWCGWNLMIPKLSSGEADATLFPPIYLGL